MLHCLSLGLTLACLRCDHDNALYKSTFTFTFTLPCLTWLGLLLKATTCMLRLHSNTNEHGGEKRRKYNKLLLKSRL